MKVNDLVEHTKLYSLGIGCISKVNKNDYRVNFGLVDKKTCKPTSLRLIDTSRCTSITFKHYRERVILTSGPDYAIIGNELHHFVGIGWVVLRVIEKSDLLKYPRVID